MMNKIVREKDIYAFVIKLDSCGFDSEDISDILKCFKESFKEKTQKTIRTNK